SCVWISSDLILSLSPHLGLPVSVVQSIRDALHFPLSIAGGEVIAGLPPLGRRPDFIMSFGTLVNLVALAFLVFALAFDGSGRLRRAGALIFIDRTDADNGKPLFRPGRKFDD